MASISIALSKGRIFDETAPLLARAGIQPRITPTSRKLVIATNRRDLRLLGARRRYSDWRRADLGIAGATPPRRRRCTSRSICASPCRMMVAVRKGFDYEAVVRQGARLRVATKYVNIARPLRREGRVDLIRLYGSMELAPLVGLADAIVDLVSTGKTLKANGLVAVEEIMPVSARPVNQAALKTKRAALQPLIDAFAQAAGR